MRSRGGGNFRPSLIAHSAGHAAGEMKRHEVAMPWCQGRAGGVPTFSRPANCRHATGETASPEVDDHARGDSVRLADSEIDSDGRRGFRLASYRPGSLSRTA
jgi:hypothetical protein